MKRPTIDAISEQAFDESIQKYISWASEWDGALPADTRREWRGGTPATALDRINFKARNEHLEISFPISPSCTLWMHARSERPDIIKVDVNEVDSDVVKELNRRILPTIQRYTYCSSERQAKWVLRPF